VQTTSHSTGPPRLDHAALRDRHLGLRDRRGRRDLDRRAAEEVQDAHALAQPSCVTRMKSRNGPWNQVAIITTLGMPDGGEALPVARVAPDDPALEQLANQELVLQTAVHGRRARPPKVESIDHA
jgi:hypothetical protein